MQAPLMLENGRETVQPDVLTLPAAIDAAPEPHKRMSRADRSLHFSAGGRRALSAVGNVEKAKVDQARRTLKQERGRSLHGARTPALLSSQSA